MSETLNPTMWEEVEAYYQGNFHRFRPLLAWEGFDQQEEPFII